MDSSEPELRPQCMARRVPGWTLRIYGPQDSCLSWRHFVGMRGAKPATVRSLNQPKAVEPYGEATPLTTKHWVVRQSFYDRSTNTLPAGEPKGLVIRCDQPCLVQPKSMPRFTLADLSPSISLPLYITRFDVGVFETISADIRSMEWYRH